MRKEFIQMLRDRVTFGILIIIPLMQLIMFGYAINTNPKHLPTVIVSSDHSPFTRAFVSALKNTDYFTIEKEVKSAAEADNMLATYKAEFVISIPPNFTRDLIRGKRPQIGVDADGTDPAAAGNALNTIPVLAHTAFNHLLVGNLRGLRDSPAPVEVVSHAKYNPEEITA
ncbi:MAG: ABC transporter permease, partial [Gammaproteobacteria bacterium]|nr:ABC transporter permease [Gammaproteobacteria bacterium]